MQQWNPLYAGQQNPPYQHVPQKRSRSRMNRLVNWGEAKFKKYQNWAVKKTAKYENRFQKRLTQPYLKQSMANRIYEKIRNKSRNPYFPAQTQPYPSSYPPPPVPTQTQPYPSSYPPHLFQHKLNNIRSNLNNRLYNINSHQQCLVSKNTKTHK